MKEELLVSRLSAVPMRVMMRSTGTSDAKDAGTWHPIWAITTATATCCSHVDLPLMLGPVIT